MAPLTLQILQNHCLRFTGPSSKLLDEGLGSSFNAGNQGGQLCLLKHHWKHACGQFSCRNDMTTRNSQNRKENVIKSIKSNVKNEKQIYKALFSNFKLQSSWRQWRTHSCLWTVTEHRERRRTKPRLNVRAGGKIGDTQPIIFYSCTGLSCRHTGRTGSPRQVLAGQRSQSHL